MAKQVFHKYEVLVDDATVIKYSFMVSDDDSAIVKAAECLNIEGEITPEKFKAAGGIRIMRVDGHKAVRVYPHETYFAIYLVRNEKGNNFARSMFSRANDNEALEKIRKLMAIEGALTEAAFDKAGGLIVLRLDGNKYTRIFPVSAGRSWSFVRYDNLTPQSKQLPSFFRSIKGVINFEAFPNGYEVTLR